MKMRSASLSSLTFVLLACGGNGSPAKGSLTVNVTGLPSGTAAAVLVTGPGGYSVTVAVTDTQTLADLAPGTYAVSPQDAVTSSSIVGDLYRGAVDQGSLVIAANATATVNVTYAPRPGAGRLWVPIGTAALDGYTAAQLAASGNPKPGVVVTTSVLPSAVAFDHDGNAWVTEPAKNTLSEYPAADLASSGTPTPAVVLSATSGSLTGPAGLAFDGQGNLWVANSGGTTVVGYTRAQLGSSGSPAPAVTLDGFGRPYGLAFDHAGDLWVSDSGNGTVAGLTPSQLAATGTPTPAITLSGIVPAAPASLAFDAAGNLWVGRAPNLLLKLTPAQLATTGTPTPDVIYLPPLFPGLQLPLAFDQGGNLWVADQVMLYQFTAASLAPGAPLPQTTIALGAPFPGFFAFDPPAPGTPIYR